MALAQANPTVCVVIVSIYTLLVGKEYMNQESDLNCCTPSYGSDIIYHFV